MARRLALGEGFVDTNQDVSALTLGQAGSQAHQLVSVNVLFEKKVTILDEVLLCTFCNLLNKNTISAYKNKYLWIEYFDFD